MAKHATLVCEVVPLGDVVTGIWCDVCLLPSKQAQDFMMVLNGTPHEAFHAEGCPECGDGWQYDQSEPTA